MFTQISYSALKGNVDRLVSSPSEIHHVNVKVLSCTNATARLVPAHAIVDIGLDCDMRAC